MKFRVFSIVAGIISGILLALFLSGCSTFSRIVRTANDASSAFCLIYANENITGLDPRAYCAIQQNLAPFVNLLLDEYERKCMD